MHIPLTQTSRTLLLLDQSQFAGVHWAYEPVYPVANHSMDLSIANKEVLFIIYLTSSYSYASGPLAVCVVDFYLVNFHSFLWTDYVSLCERLFYSGSELVYICT